MEGEEEGLLVQGHLLRVQSHGSQAHEPPRRTPDQHGGVGLEGGGGGGGRQGLLHMEPHGHLWPRRALLPVIIREEFTTIFQTLHNWPLTLESIQLPLAAHQGRSGLHWRSATEGWKGKPWRYIRSSRTPSDAPPLTLVTAPHSYLVGFNCLCSDNCI